MSEKTTESSKAQDIARKVGSLLAPHQDVLRECRGEFEARLKDEEADWERRCNACTSAEEREALDRERAEKEPLRSWLRRERPFAVRVMRLALLHDDTLPKASRLLGSPEDDSPHIVRFRQDFRLEVSGVADADEMFRVAYSDDQLPAWDDEVLDGLQDDLKRVEMALDERERQVEAAARTATETEGAGDGSADRHSTRLQKPPKIAFVAYALNEQIGDQEKVAKELRAQYRKLCDKGIIDGKKRSTFHQGDVSKWCIAVREWREAGNAMPSPDEFQADNTVQHVDPQEVIEVGEREDRHTPRQRAKQNPDSIDDWD